jgi:putative tricarboxylic transport membrane protein
MTLLNNVFYGFSVSFEPYNLLACFIGVFIGTLIGVLPGIGPTATLSLLLPITFRMSPTSSIIMMCGIFYGAMYGGSTTSVLVNIPGEAASVVTCLDGHAMARKGRAGPALGICAFGSFIAGTLGVVGLMLVAPPLAQMALRFGPPEIFGVLLLGFTMITYLARGSALKAVIMGIVGFILATVGIDQMSGQPRLAYGSITLSDGIGLVPVAMGVFGVAEVLLNIEEIVQTEIFKAKIKGLLPTKQDWKDSAGAIGRGSALGFFLGILPGLGAIVPTFISYALEKRLSRHPERFGTGEIAGVAGPESANNAATAGSMIPLLTLGIPPNTVLAVLLGVFLIHGVPPGPQLMEQHPEIFWGVITSMYTGNIMLLILNLPLIGLWVKLLKIPYRILFPMILLFCLIGVYSVANNIWDIVIMVIFGVIGYFMKKLEYEPAPLILALVLGRMAEESLRQSLVLSRGSLRIFLDRPISRGALILALILVLSSLLAPSLKRILRRSDPEE